ncbi:MAG: lactonase family protein [Acidobacteriota bacterium]|nr:lactonase family protein [Acidobacteriota bacterium]
MPQITRRGFLYASAATAIASRTAAAQADHGHLLLVGTQTSASSKGIYAYRFNPATGELHQVALAAETKNPTFLTLAPDRKTVFAADEVDHFDGKTSGAISSYTLDRANTRLTPINQVATGGGGTCHVATDHTGRSVFAANYGGGSAASFTAGPGGHLSDAVSFFQYTGQGPNHDRQAAPHAHRVTVSPDNRFLLVNDLGLDAIHIYRLDPATAKLTPNDPAVWRSNPGAGPRALQFHPNGKVAYCVTEMASGVVVLHWDSTHGTLETVQELAMKPADFQGTTGGADIALDHRARFAYAIDRFDNIVVTFSIAADGKLALRDRIPCGGKVPRHLALDPSGRWLLVANQDSDNISALKINPATGQLSDTGKSFPLSKPQCLVFA